MGPFPVKRSLPLQIKSPNWYNITMKNDTSLSKFLATSGVAARRKATDLIKEGLVTVNNEIVTEPGYKIRPRDVIKYDDKIVRTKEKIYILLNKPRNYITSAQDEQGRKTVLDLVKYKKERLYPVGRLDRETTGLLLLTNDGELAEKLAHPKHQTEKDYRVTLNRPLESADFDQLILGVKLFDGFIKPDRLYIVPETKKYQVIIQLHSGRNRIIRRIFAKFNYKVRQLDRFKYAGLTKKNLPVGHWRLLGKKEIEQLKQQ